ncbi:MAG TPA: hypothetical protein VHU23_00225 [Rhizomicrobium sp.]|jgi:hypothetical protein|nr:hypothetical protein [Rhizomicrobium sp.]
MNSEALFGELCARVARVFSFVLESRPAGTILSIDIGGSFLDRLAWSAAIAFGCEFANFPSLMRCRARLWDYRHPLKPVDVAREPVMFGRCDGWLQCFDATGVWKNYALDAGNVAVRSIDSWAQWRGPLRLVHFGDIALLADQIRGAAQTLAQDRPLVTLYPPQSPAERSVVLSLLQQAEYEVLDLQGQQVRNAAGAGSWGWIAVSRDVWAALALHPSADVDDAQAFWVTEQMENTDVPLRQRRSGEIFGLGRIAPPQLMRTIPVSEIICVNDCYPMETDGKSTWRWLGPLPRSRVAVPCAFPGTYRFDVAVINCRTPGGLGACRVLVNGREVAVFAQGEERGKLGFVGRLDAADYAGYAEIDFINREAPPPAGSDPRTLRINLGAIGMAPCH